LLPIIRWKTHNQTQFDNSTISILDVLNNFMKNLFTVKSSDCSILLSRLQTSKAPSTPATCRSNMSNSTCRSNYRQLVAFDIRHVECYKLPVASTCCWCGRGFRHIVGSESIYVSEV